jgi:hypothetical protein
MLFPKPVAWVTLPLNLFFPSHFVLFPSALNLVRDPSVVRRLFVRLAGAVGRQSALHKENSGFVAATLRRHISKFCGYQILFSIRNPYINCFTNHFSIHS